MTASQELDLASSSQGIEPSNLALNEGEAQHDDETQPQVPQNVVPTSPAEASEQDAAAFDMRSIHDHPIGGKPPVDAAWDTTKQDVFDEATPAALQNVVVLKSQAFSPAEEKKEQNDDSPLPDDWESVGAGFGTGTPNDTDTDHAETNEASEDVPEEAFSHLSLAGMDDSGEPIVTMDDDPNEMEGANKDESENMKLRKDDEPLLGRQSSSSGVLPEDEESSGKPIIPVEKRIEMYSNMERDEDSSVDSDGANDDDDDESDDNDQPEEVAYVNQNLNEEEEAPMPQQQKDNNDVQEVPQEDTEPEETVRREDAPTFEPAIVAAMNADASGPSLAPTTAETATTKADSPAKKIPLIAPPPAGKLEKWEESKTRGQKYLAAKKYVTPEKKGSPTPQTNSNRFATPEKVKSPGEMSISPSSGGSNRKDQRMAEKIALASSAAAVTFAEQYQPDTIIEKPEAEEEQEGSFVQQSNGMLCGAFTWESADSYGQDSIAKTIRMSTQQRDLFDEHSKQKIEHWFLERVLMVKKSSEESTESLPLRTHLDDNSNFNAMCQYIADCCNGVTVELGMASPTDMAGSTDFSGSSPNSRDSDSSMGDGIAPKRPWLKPMKLTDTLWNTTSGTVAAANFVNFLFLAAKLSKRPSPFGDRNPFIDDLVTNSLTGTEVENTINGNFSPQQLIFEHPRGHAEDIVQFVYTVSLSCESQKEKSALLKLKRSFASSELGIPPRSRSDSLTGFLRAKSGRKSRLLIVPEGHPSPFEASVWNSPRILAAFLSFLGNPVAVCRMKMVNRFCYRIISENQHVIMKDAVRTGGINMNVRPAFWMWVTLQQFNQGQSPPKANDSAYQKCSEEELRELSQTGKDGKWQHVIERDVLRSFGNMPPHKSVARLQNDSIVRALVTWGQNRIMTRGVKGGGEPLPIPHLGSKEQRKSLGKPPRSNTPGNVSSPPWLCSGNFEMDEDALRIDTAVSDWSGVSPVPSFTGSHAESLERTNSRQFSDTGQLLPLDELALGGNCLKGDMKAKLQDKLRFVLHALATSHEGVGYCQGMDYVVAHLLRILQDTVMWKASKGTLPSVISSAPEVKRTSNMEFRDQQQIIQKVENSLVVEEVIFKVMDTLFTTYSLKHIYWPELRCLKTFCRVFERLIQIKLPVLADHFEHHDLNVGLFALGWFQTLFLYLPSMPSATVCHMWDIWLVERSFKIFFRVGTAILFLSQPTLLNNELEGMMTYLNTFPDATLLKPDILIPCALNIKVTNRLLQSLEAEVTASGV
ncbi:unnamed protein product [Cylindrotheca closterium]|uniref:Rab-GAP TBC domain-containing protein n=1 Tax=Cylindrotheca closterium TaxID=2856 RepID=A0AAD2FLR9_9STRA|nr:unnamed protein product [Cylindrotheca closterium]